MNDTQRMRIEGRIKSDKKITSNIIPAPVNGRITNNDMDPKIDYLQPTI